MIRVVIPGPPQPQQRAMIARPKGRAKPTMMERPKSRSWKHLAQAYFTQACRRPLEGPVELQVLVRFECPRTEHRVREPRVERWADRYADWDNLGKIVSDAANGVLWIDDRQVARAVVEKRIAAQGEPPCVIVEVRPLGALAGAEAASFA